MQKSSRRLKKEFEDQMGRSVQVEHPPQRIISLVPSQTELLFYLGLEIEVVGITKFCVHPQKMWQSKPRVGGTKQYNFEKIKSLRPDLIIGNKEENDQAQIEQIAQDFPVWMSDILTLEDAYNMIQQIGVLTKTTTNALQLIDEIKSAFQKIKTANINLPNRSKTAYLIWKNPYMVAADQTFINEMLQVAGFENIFAERIRYPEISPKELAEAQPDFVFLSSEPYPFQEKHLDEIRTLCPNANVQLVDGEMFSWYGSRLLLAARYFSDLRNLCV